MDIFEGKNKRYCKRLTKFGRNIVLRIKPRAAMFFVRFAKLKSRALSHEPSSDCVIARAKGPVRAQAAPVVQRADKFIHWIGLSDG